MKLTELRALFAEFGARPCHQDSMLRAWASGRALDADARSPLDFFPARLRAAFAQVQVRLDRLARVQSEARGVDGSERLLLALADGRTIESVLLPREGLCVSSQVGCAVGCLFCMTGRGGLERQLGSAEIVAQVARARARRQVRKVVFMGMGEPAHNLDNVLDAIGFLGTLGGLAHKNLVFSTVGDARAFERLGKGRVKPALALSLHSTMPDLRARLLPRAPRLDPAELVARAEAYARATGYPVQFQWTLLEGVNDGDEELENIARLLAGKYAVMNFIPYNAVEGLDFDRPDWARAAAMARFLHRRGILAKLRHSAGQDIDGACGQLRARAAAVA